MKYIRLEWPEIQDYMLLDCYNDDEVGFDSMKNCWYVPEDWEKQYYEEYYEDEFSGGDIGDLDDALG